ncbi:MAG: putative amidoligase enzyme [Pelotomaculum sp. PtaB.Bin104]|nr:MAG: putative amidoligase enzyme [Pelotomaculum sp. PtaB.Bin104]
MPKGRTGRGGVSGASGEVTGGSGLGAGMGGGGSASTAGALNEIMAGRDQVAPAVDPEAAAAGQLVTGPFEVEVPSRTRSGRPETMSVTFISEDEAEVDSGSGRTYRTSVERCTCPDYIYRRGTCRHMEAYNQALGLRETRVRSDSTSTGGVSGWEQDDMQREENGTLRELDQLEERERQERLARWEEYQRQHDDGTFLTRDDEAFNNLYEMASDSSNIEYQYENVLGGSENTFGIEIEFTGADLNAVARDMHAAGLVSSSTYNGYHDGRVPGMWAVERDGSVSSGNIGGEVISPVLRDNPETWRQLEKVCEIVRRNGGQVDMRCGGHVHVGADPLDERTWRWMRLARLVSGFEDVIYRVAAGGESGGEHRGVRDNYHYSAPMPVAVDRFFHNRRVDPNYLISEISPRRYYGLNLKNVGQGNKNTVEFRHFNGSLDPKQIQVNVKIANAIVHAAQSIRKNRVSTRERAQLIPDHPNRLGGSNRNADNDGHDQVRRFVDTIFNNAKDKAAALWLYATSRWQRR